MERSAATRLIDFLRSRRDGMVRLLEALARTESPSGDQPSQRQVQALLARELATVGMKVRCFHGRQLGELLYARAACRRRGAHAQLMHGHCDTVWPLGTLAQMPVTSTPEAVRGPGVLDMKAGLVQMVFALRALHELELHPSLTPIVLLNADEEIGSPQSTRTISRLARRAARAFVLEPAFGPSGKLKTARKAVGRFTVIVKGKAAHAGIDPEHGISAILELSHQVQKLFALNDPARGITVNVGTIDGGLRPNVVAPEAKAIVDVRVPTQQDAQETERALQNLRPALEGTRVEVRGSFGRLAMEPTDRNQALWRLARDLGRELGLELDQAAVGGASDGSTTSQYTATLDGLGGVGAGAHAPDEMVDVSGMVERCALLSLLLLAPLVEPADLSQKKHQSC
jgi:glutamate carboxypeptidase